MDITKDRPFTPIAPYVLGKWYRGKAPDAARANPGTPQYEFRTDGTYLKDGKVVPGVTFTTTENKLTVTSASTGKETLTLTYAVEADQFAIQFTHFSGRVGAIRAGTYFKHLDADILGKWYTDKGTLIQILDFKVDGRFFIGNGATDYYAQYGGIFTAAAGKLRMIAPGEEDIPTTYTIQEKTLTITTPAGKTNQDTGWTAGTYYKK